MAAPLRILIVGGGIAGLALGRALREHGFAAEIIERATSWSAPGTGLYLPANGVRALEALGLVDTLLGRAVRITHQRLLNHRGRLLADIDLAKVWGVVGPCVGIARAELHRILLEGCADVTIRFGATATTLAQDHGAVHVGFADGSKGEYDVLVAADGIQSSIRRLLSDGTGTQHVGQVSWRFLVDRNGGIDMWTAMLGHDRAFLMMPVARNRLYCYADLTTNDTEDPTQRDVARLRALFRDFAEPVPDILSHLESFDSLHFSPIEEVAVHTWGEGHVVLIGDAAHATSPNMAEGASMALEDALVLSRMLASHHSIADALSAFRERRRARTQWVQQRTHRRDRIRTLPSPLRDLGLRMAGSVLYRRDYLPLFGEP